MSAAASADGSAGYGKVSIINPLIQSTAPGKLKYKWNYLWKDTGDSVRGKIMMDEVATFSVTEMGLADQMSRVLLELPGITRSSKVVDANACVGGNTVSFAKFFDRVVGIEMSEERARMLDNNVRLCGEDIKRSGRPYANVQVVTGNCLAVVPSIIDADVVFYDPPWGGVKYGEKELIPLSLSNVPMSKIVLYASTNCTYVALKMPLNADLRNIVNVPKVLTVVRKMLMRKMQFIVVKKAR